MQVDPMQVDPEVELETVEIIAKERDQSINELVVNINELAIIFKELQTLVLD